MNKKALAAFGLFVSISLLACSLPSNSKSGPQPLADTSPKNIILFIGDGMGPSYMKAYRMFKDNPKTPKVEASRFDPLFVGLLTTDPSVLDDVTDSAASATAMATGHKVANGVLSVDKNNKALVTILEKAKQLGLSTGLVATSTISHATPAAFASHINNRRLQSQIADQYIDNRYQNMPYIDVLLGGGRVYFERDDRNISQEFSNLGYQLIANKRQLQDNNQPKILGLFAQHVFKKMIDRDPQTPSLADMTKAAIKQLSKNKKGFFLMVEASQIDFAGHIQDISGVMSEMQDLDVALQVAMEFVDQSPAGDSQILLTADHSTGGLSVGSEVNGKKYYRWNPKVLRSIEHTPEWILGQAIISQDLVGEFEKATHIKLTAEEKQKVIAMQKSQLVRTSGEITDLNYQDVKLVYGFLAKIISDRSYTGWTTHGHTGEDVQLYAYGQASEQLRGHWPNTKIANSIFGWLDKLNRQTK